MQLKIICVSLNFFISLFLLIPIQAKDDLPKLLTPDQAEAIVRQHRSGKEARQRAQRLTALGEKATEERILDLEDGQQLVFRKIAPTPKAANSKKEIDAVPPIEASLQSVNSVILSKELAYDSIHLGANVYGNDYSEVTWRDQESGQSFTVWTNINLNYLRPINAFEADGIQYNYFGFVTAYSYEAKQGAVIKSNWKTPPVVFSADQYEYFIDAHWDTQVPEKLYRQLDALFGYYLANRERLEIEHKNARLLQAAQKKDLEENPPKKPKQIIMNYTPLRGEAAE